MASEGLPIPATVASAAPASGAPAGANTATAPSGDFLALIGQLIQLPEASGAGELPGIALPGQLDASLLPEAVAAEMTGDTDDSPEEEELFDPEAFIASLGSLTVKQPAPAQTDDGISITSSVTDGNRTAPNATAAEILASVLSETDAQNDPALSQSTDPTTGNSVAPQIQPATPQHHSPAAADNVVHRDLRSPVGSQAWADELGDQMTWMARNGHESASLRLNPEHLGPVEVRLTIRDGEASVWFGASNADTRSALEQSLPRLRELFASQGMVLADAGVFREAPREQPRAVSLHHSSGAPSDDESVNVTAVSSSRGLVDTYA